MLGAIGLDIQLMTAGSCGGLVKSIFDKSKVIDSVATMTAGALTSNYFAGPCVSLVASGALFGFKLDVGQGVAGFGVGMFAVVIVGWLSGRLRSKLDGENK